jgi:hypothetical protein
MKTNQSTYGKILLHGMGTGGITEKDIERRARELAFINGVPFTMAFADKYFAQARQELTGGNLPPTTSEANEAMGAMTRDPSEPLTQTGHQVPDLEEPDGQTDQEHLAEEGVEEAQHEQMLEARRRARKVDRRI